jgi:glutaredoxin 2
MPGVNAAKVGLVFTVGSVLGASVATVFLKSQKRQLASVASKKLIQKTQALPKLYIYEHCPFCVRARMIFGLKNVKHDLVFLANHDEATPIALVGAKQVPILELPDGKAMPESMDIVRYVDEHYGDAVLLKESSEREEIKKWIKDTSDVFRLLYHPRFHRALFAEFAQLESREYYRIKKEKAVGPFEDALSKTPQLVQQANKYLEELDQMLYSSESVNEQLSYDDIDLFGRLRGLTLVKDLKWPTKLRTYVENMSKKTDIALLDSMAQY